MSHEATEVKTSMHEPSASSIAFGFEAHGDSGSLTLFIHLVCPTLTVDSPTSSHRELVAEQVQGHLAAAHP